MSDTLTKSVAHGVTSLGIAHALNQILHFVSTITLARLLLPEDFGIIAMTVIITDLVMNTGDMGFATALIQRKEVTPSHLSTAFWTGLALGIIFSIVTVAVSPFVADFFRNELVGPVLAVQSLIFVFAPLRYIHGSLLMKRLQFLRLSITEVGQGITYLVASISLAFAGFGVWSIVLGSLISQLVLVILRWILCRWHPSFTFSTTSLKELWRFGSNLTGSRIIHFLAKRLDYLIIGRFLTSAALGFYSMGYRVVSIPTTTLYITMGRVAFPAFSIIQDENERLRRGFLKSITFISIIGLPLFAGAAVVGPELIKVVLGQKWIDVTLPLQVLCIMGGFNTLGLAVIALVQSKGRTDINLKLSIANLVLLIPCLIIGVRFGMIGVAIAISTVTFILWPVQQIFANRLIDLKMKEYLISIWPAAFGTTVMAMVLLAIRYTAASMLTLPDIWLLVSSVVLGAIIYFATLKATRIEALNEMIRLVVEIVRPYLRLVMVKLGFLPKEAPHININDE